MEIAGKKAVVVGGASGFGKATAEALAKRGASVAILDRPQSKGKEVADAVGGTFYEVDVTDFEGTEKVAATGHRRPRRPAHRRDHRGRRHRRAHHQQGRPAQPGHLPQVHRPEPHRHLQHQPAGGLADEQERAGDDEAEERGVIINTASIAAFEGQIGQVAYTAAKAAIAGMCLTMARDLGSLGIRVLAIAPSLFATGLTEGIPDEFAAALTKDAAFPKRLGRPEEYAKLALAIVENPMLNGQCLRLDAGQRFAPK